MTGVQILWDLEDDPDGNVQHIAANGVSVEEYVEVFASNYEKATVSRESGRPIAFGWTRTGKHIAVVWDEIQSEDPLIIRPVTAFETPPKRRKRR
jgi:uncharacterized DUF497 family protein